MTTLDTKELATRIRKKCISIAARPTGCHLGGSLSVIDILTVLFAKVYNPLHGDEIILSKGHAAAALYATLYETGLISMDPSLNYGGKESPFTGHPNNSIDYIRFATGSLGHGPALGLGWALGQKLSGQNGNAYVVMGDGELQEGSCWETFQIAASKHAGNFIIIIDKNNAQNDGWVDDISSLRDLKSKMNAFGFNCITVNGHDHLQMEEVLSLQKDMVPLCIIAKTIKGKGVAMLENKINSHYVKINTQTAHKWSQEISS